MKVPPESLRKLCSALFICGLILLTGLSFLPNSATAIWQIRWYPLYLSSVGLLLLGIFAFRIPEAQRDGPSSVSCHGFILLISTGYLLSALLGPFPGRTLIYSFPIFAALCCGSVLLDSLKAKDVKRMFSAPLFQGLFALYVLSWSAASLFQFVSRDVIPFFSSAKVLDVAGGGGLYDLIVQKGISGLRNEYFFGHQNYLSGFLMMLLPLLYFGILRPARKGYRLLSSLALILGVLVLLSTQSRNAFVGILVALAVLLLWTRPALSKIIPLGVGLLIFSLGILFFVPRFHHFLSVSPGRFGIWKSAWLTGVDNFPLGSGEGLTPELMQRFSPELPAMWSSSMQFHQTWLHVWAVGGLIAFVGMIGLTLWFAGKVVNPKKISAETRMYALPSAMAISGGLVVFLADYQLDIFPIALLFFFQVAVFQTLTRGETGKQTSSSRRWIRIAVLIPFICLAVSVTQLPSSIQSRRAVEKAGLAFEENRLADSVEAFLEAYEAVKEPYALNMAAITLLRIPNTRAEALSLFDRSLQLWEPQTLVHEYLVDVWLNDAASRTEVQEKKESLQKALHHARRRAEIAPQLKGSYLDLALLSHELNYPEEEIVDALFYEMMMTGDLLFPATWEALGNLRQYRPQVLARLFSEETSSSVAFEVRKAALQSYILLMEEVPPEVTVSESLRKRSSALLSRPGSLSLLNEFCKQEAQDQPQALKQLLVYLFKLPMSDENVSVFMENREKNVGCIASVLRGGQAQMMLSGYGGVGIRARHPYSVPVLRPRSYPEVFGSKFLPALEHKIFQLPPEE